MQEEDDEKLTMDELLSNCILLLFAGHETTANLIGNGMFELLTHPDQLEHLKASPELTESAVTEMLRYRSSIPVTFRRALKDTQFKRIQFQKDQGVLISLAAANRDPEVYTNPEQFDIQRNEAPPVAFGHGIHYCLGAPLAKLEAEIAFQKLFEKMPNLQVKNPEPDWVPSLAIRALNTLHLTY